MTSEEFEKYFESYTFDESMCVFEALKDLNHNFNKYQDGDDIENGMYITKSLDGMLDDYITIDEYSDGKWSTVSGVLGYKELTKEDLIKAERYYEDNCTDRD